GSQRSSSSSASGSSRARRRRPPPRRHAFEPGTGEVQNGRTMTIPTFRDEHDKIAAILREHGCLAGVLVDLHPLAQIERSFGGAAYQSLRAQIDPLMLEVKDRFRQGDLLTRDEREGDRFLLFLSGKRGSDQFTAGDLRKLADRVEEALSPRVGRLTLPYLRERPMIDVGYGVVLFSPL